MDEHEKDIERISIGVDLDTFGEKPEQGLDWKNEVQELLWILRSLLIFQERLPNITTCWLGRYKESQLMPVINTVG